MAETLRKRPFPVHLDEHSRTLTLVEAVDPGREPDGISVVIAYGDTLARAGLHALLDVEQGIAVAGSTGDGEEALALAREVCPDILLIEMELPGIPGVEVTRRIVADPDTSEVRILVLAASEEDEDVFSSLRAGASGFLLRDAEPGELVDGVRAVAAGEAALSASAMRLVIAELASQPDPHLPGPAELDELTAREREVMGLVAAGLSNDQIAEHLTISWATAKTHVSRALTKLNARDRAQLVTLAYETGLVLPRQPTAVGLGIPSATLAAA
jgi:DNA-binding NarL/FixJ family response regulator